MGVIAFKPVLPSPPSQPSPIEGEGAKEAANAPELAEYIPLSARQGGRDFWKGSPGFGEILRSSIETRPAWERISLRKRAGEIAIDGQVAAGKTAVGRELARRLGCPFLDTGIMYRAVTWLALRQSVPTEDECALTELAQNATMQLNDLEGRTILLDGKELGPELRSRDVDESVSPVSTVSGVRKELVRQQRAIAEQSCEDLGGIVMVGRDIGTVVLPNAALKVFMTASAEVRARRRYEELISQGLPADYDEVLANALARDRMDSQRADSPLSQAPDAFLVDSGNLTIDQVVATILERLDQQVGLERMDQPGGGSRP